MQTKIRVLDWWAKIENSQQDILIVSHDNILRIIIANVLKMRLDDIWQFRLHPAAITVIENNKLICLNDKNYLIGLEADLSVHAL